MQWDYSTDFIVVGSGAGGMAASVAASILGGDSLVIEKTAVYGGTTALSGGVIWVPNNTSMAAAGIADCEEDGVRYLQQVIGPDVPVQKIRSYVQQAPVMVRFLEQNTSIVFHAAERYADYYPELEGGKSGGRSMESLPISRKKLGKNGAQL